MEAERPDRTRDWDELVAVDPVTAAAAAAAVQDVDQAVPGLDRDRELASRGHDLGPPKLVTAHREDGDRVAARVHREQQAIRGVEGQRTLRRERIGGAPTVLPPRPPVA